MDRRRDDGAGNAQALRHVALHLRAQHQLGLRRDNRVLHFEVVIRDEGCDAVFGSRGAQFARIFARVGAKAADGEAEFLGSDMGRGDRVRGVAEDEDALARQVGRVDRARVPRQARPAGWCMFRGETCCLHHGCDEGVGRQRADRLYGDEGLSVIAFQPFCGDARDLRIEHDVEVGVRQPGQIGNRCSEWRDHVDRDAQTLHQLADLDDVVTVPEPERGGAEDVAHLARCTLRDRSARCRSEGADEAI